MSGLHDHRQKRLPRRRWQDYMGWRMLSKVEATSSLLLDKQTRLTDHSGFSDMLGYFCTSTVTTPMRFLLLPNITTADIYTTLSDLWIEHDQITVAWQESDLKLLPREVATRYASIMGIPLTTAATGESTTTHTTPSASARTSSTIATSTTPATILTVHPTIDTTTSGATRTPSETSEHIASSSPSSSTASNGQSALPLWAVILLAICFSITPH
ncbi:hypothetical protein F5Y05DRAFT_255673 [Hypoxylon sp. FL0543]|nr:hypothetical protein F5Y05DRAFT_255673 [Hypoxylon sp. FL0543]